MQRLAGNFLVNRMVMLHIGNGNISELYELPNGQWQFGKDRDATVIQRLDQVFKLPPQSRWINAADYGEGYLTNLGKDADGLLIEEPHPFNELGDLNVLRSLEAWLLKVKTRAQAPVAMHAGLQGNVESESAHARAHRRIDTLSPEVVARLLLAVENTLGPIDDSIQQPAQVNSHSDGYGDGETYAPADVPGFKLPLGAKWVDDRTPSAGYLTPLGSNDEKGHPIMQWHPTPEFLAMTERAEMGSSLDAIPPRVHDPVQDEINQERQKQPENARSSRSRKR
jgi:hypothetical protein